MPARPVTILIFAGLAATVAGCVVESRCFTDADCSGGRYCCEAEGVCLASGSCCDDADCPAGRGCLLTSGTGRGSCSLECTADEQCASGEICDQPAGAAVGICSPPECSADGDCAGDRHRCVERRCEPTGQVACPDDMVPVEDEFCIDRYEASRPDATETSAGLLESMAIARAGVLPWAVASNSLAQTACEAAGKSLCTPDEWYRACAGPEVTVYAYGDDYEPATCNGIDTHCYCDVGSTCADQDPCPFPGCYFTCSGSFHLEPTGSRSGCTNAYGLFDINGNIWEHVLDGNDSRVRGGAFNCSDSEQFHRCDYVPGTWTPVARGFRCCSPGVAATADGGPAGGDPGGGDPGPGDAAGGD